MGSHMTEDFYDLLEVPTDASQEEIKRAFREQVRVYHPDHNDDDRARAQFTAVKKAYEILGDPVERQAYDRLGHRDYVAKRTSGIPSPDVWASDDSGSRRVSGASSGSANRRSASGSTRGSSSSGTASAAGTRSSPDEATTSGAHGSTADSGRSSAGSGRTSTGSDRASASAGTGRAAASGSTTATGSTTPGTSAGTATTTAGSPAGGSRTAGGSSSGGLGAGRTGRRRSAPRWLAENPLARWWRNWNPASALLWLPTLAYLAGLAEFALENEDGLRELAAALSAAGGEPAAFWAALTGSRYGIESPLAFLAGTEPVDPPLEPVEFHAVLGGLVALALVAAVGARIAWRGDTFGAIGRTETVVVATAVGVATGLVGGPLLAGVVLMPALFAVVIHWTRRLPGWSPSYVYVFAVGTPALALGAAVAGYTSLAGELVAFAVLPVVGAVGLPLRVAIRRRFGR